MKYIVTIYNRTTGTTDYFNRDSGQGLGDLINKELGGWDNLHGAMTSGIEDIEQEYFTAGTTKNNLFCYSILAVNEDYNL